MEEYTYTINTIIDEENNLLDVAKHPRMIVKLPCELELEKYSMMRLKTIDKNGVL